MIILIIARKAKIIHYSIYKLYNKKFVLQLRGTIDITNFSNVQWQIFNNQSQLIATHNLNNLNQEDKLNYQKLANDIFAKEYNAEIVIHQLDIPNNNEDEISRINQDKIKQLTQTNPPENQQTLHLTNALIENLLSCKHYAYFNNSFHIGTKQINANLINHEIEQKGVLFASILLKLSHFTKKQITKNKWIIIYIDDTQICLNSIKNGKSDMLYTTSFDSNTFGNLNEIIMMVYNFANTMGGLDGIIFTGTLGVKEPAIRHQICQNFEWIGMKISNKLNQSNKPQINKKTSTIEIFNIIADEEIFILKQLAQRI